MEFSGTTAMMVRGERFKEPKLLPTA